ncbi:hypothetical protein SRRS_18210 [Sporomusa rhizae]|uniref:hypothetical protein n=1 Tax=Sporomusa rhizae TaxID=357999 RepID=UPI00352BCD06
MSEYQLDLDNQYIIWGTRIDIDSLAVKSSMDSITQHSNGYADWNLPSGVYHAKDIIRELDTLLEAILIQLGTAADADALLNSIRSSMSLSGRESVLPLESLSLEHAAGAEITKQAKLIGETLSQWAREFNSQRWAFKKCGQEKLARLRFRSHCNGHLWTVPVFELLAGPTGSPVVMQLFNEYMHQLVLLREALIPFDNWDEVPIEVIEKTDEKGLRFLEEAHTKFLSELLGKRLTHKAIVGFAQSLLSPELSAVGYGFQYRFGTILPASLGESPTRASKYLLHWHPVWTVVTDTHKPLSVAFDYVSSDYYSIPRSQIGTGQPLQLDLQSQEIEDIHEAQLIPVRSGSNRFNLQYRLRINSTYYEIDLGQAFRGHRFMYRPNQCPKSDSGLPVTVKSDIKEHRAGDVLALTGLVTDDSGIHFISTGGNHFVQWALLGKLYPENVVVLDKADEKEFKSAQNSGKGFGTKFLIH